MKRISKNPLYGKPTGKLFVSLSKPGLFEFAKRTKNFRSKHLIVYLFLLKWTQLNPKKPLACEQYRRRFKNKFCWSTTRPHSRPAQAKICWSDDLTDFLKRYCHLGHLQVQRYLKEFERQNLIIRDDKQVWLDGKIRPQKFLSKRAWLLPRDGEKYLVADLREMTKKGQCPFIFLENSLSADSHPRAKQLKFNMSRQTRWIRSKQAQNGSKPRLKATVSSKLVNRMISFNNLYPSLDPDPSLKSTPVNSTVFARKQAKNYDGLFKLQTGQKIREIPWHRCKRQNIPAGPGAPVERIIWHGKRLYQQSATDKFLFIYRPQDYRENSRPARRRGQDRARRGHDYTRQNLIRKSGLSRSAYIAQLERANRDRFKLARAD